MKIIITCKHLTFVEIHIYSPRFPVQIFEVCLMETIKIIIIMPYPFQIVHRSFLFIAVLPLPNVPDIFTPSLNVM